MAISLSFTGEREIVLRLKNVKGAAFDALARGLYLEGEKIMTKSKMRVPVGVDGALRASGHVQPPQIVDKTISVDLGFGGASSPYAVVVHEGRRPGGKMPPVDALKVWARKKLGDENLAYPVARKIARAGTKPTKYLEEPFRAASAGMAHRLAWVVRKALGT